MQIPTGLNHPPPTQTREAALRQKAMELEGVFLAEMLGHAGVGATEGAMGGGVGEAQLASFLRQEQAAQIARTGGLGLAETLFEAMKKVDDHGE